MAESSKALAEIVTRPVDTRLVAAKPSLGKIVGTIVGTTLGESASEQRNIASNNRQGISGAQDYFYQQAENLLRATLRYSSQANCAREALAMMPAN